MSRADAQAATCKRGDAVIAADPDACGGPIAMPCTDVGGHAGSPDGPSEARGERVSLGAVCPGEAS